MADKSEKTKARLPRGFADRSAEDIRAVEKMMATIRSVYELYGFEPADQPLIEYTDALGKFLPDQDRPNEGVFSFQDDDDQWLSLRYDLTAPTARYVAENYERLPKPYRSYRSGWVFRNEKPGPGRFRQFMQFDADTIGTPGGIGGAAADAEMCMMMADVMEKLGINRGSTSSASTIEKCSTACWRPSASGAMRTPAEGCKYSGRSTSSTSLAQKA